VVIIPSRTPRNLLSCLQAVGRQEPEAWRIVIDDGIGLNPTGGGQWDGAYEQVIPGVHPFIFSRAINQGIHAAGKYDVVLLNDDALLETPGGFSLLADTQRQNREFGLIGATTNVTGQPLQRPHGIGLREVDHLAFVCVFIPRTTIQQVGMLDQRYCLDYGVEDRDYCEAVRRAGLKVGVHDGCFVDHGSLTSSFRRNPKAPRPYAKNFALFQAKCAEANRTGHWQGYFE
jgi:GT2 family glycosyltransferase